MTWTAILRDVPESLARCELTHLERHPIDVALARAQHREYERVLRGLGCAIEQLPPAPDLPDSVFVEDVAVVVAELGVITRPGAESRRPETASMVQALARHRAIQRLQPPGTLDGGDVLRLGRRVYVGISTRTNEHGARQLAGLLVPFGYAVRWVRVHGCLHLKSAVTSVSDDVIVCNPEWVDASVFEGMSSIVVHPDEPFAANVLRVGGAVICPAAHVRTGDALERRGFEVHRVDVSELARAEGGVTCCSVIIET